MIASRLQSSVTKAIRQDWPVRPLCESVIYKKPEKLTTRVLIPRGFEDRFTEKHSSVWSVIQKRMARRQLSGLRNSKDDWVEIPREAFKAAAGTYYRRYLDDFHSWNLLLSTPYSNSRTSPDGTGFCRSYKITEETLRSGTVEVKIPMTRIQQENYQKQKTLQLEGKGLDLSPRGVEYEKSIAHMVTMDPGYRKKIRSVFKQKMKVAYGYAAGEKRNRAIESAEAWKNTAVCTTQAIENCDWWVTECVGHRFHSPINSMPKILRKYLRMNGEELVEIDICNSQPAILVGVMATIQEKSFEETTEYLRLVDRMPQKPGKRIRKIVSRQEYMSNKLKLAGYEGEEGEILFSDTSGWKEYRRRHMTQEWYDENLKLRAESIRTALSDTGNIDKYKEDVASGKFYECIMKACAIPSEQRPEVKREILKAFYDTVWGKMSPIGEKVKELYPAIYAFLMELKKEAYPAAAILMQRKESEVIRTEDLMRLLSLFVHDAVLVTKDKTVEARSLIAEQLKGAGIAAKLEVNEPVTRKKDRRKTEGEKAKAGKQIQESKKFTNNKLTVNRLKVSRLITEKLKADRLNTGKSEEDRLNTGKSEEDKLNTEKPETNRLKTEKPETDKLFAEKPETDRLNTEKLETTNRLTETLTGFKLEKIDEKSHRSINERDSNRGIRHWKQASPGFKGIISPLSLVLPYVDKNKKIDYDSFNQLPTQKYRSLNLRRARRDRYTPQGLLISEDARPPPVKRVALTGF